MMITADGLNDALVGVTTKGVAVYDVDKILAILMERDGMTEEEALEYFDFNIEGAYMGEQTPHYVFFDEWIEQVEEGLC
jgi:hypothetical protein